MIKQKFFWLYTLFVQRKKCELKALFFLSQISSCLFESQEGINILINVEIVIPIKVEDSAVSIIRN